MTHNYEFIKIYEMGYTLSIEKVVAKDLPKAMQMFIEKHNIDDYDLIAIDGVIEL